MGVPSIEHVIEATGYALVNEGYALLQVQLSDGLVILEQGNREFVLMVREIKDPFRTPPDRPDPQVSSLRPELT
jgi:hypothetical protein